MLKEPLLEATEAESDDREVADDREAATERGVHVDIVPIFNVNLMLGKFEAREKRSLDCRPRGTKYQFHSSD